MRDPYQALGLPPGATEAEIKRAYRQLMRRFHPDLNPGKRWAQDRFVEVRSAYELLTDRHQRARLDAARQRARATRPRAAPPKSEPKPEPIVDEDVYVPRNGWRHWVAGLLGY